MYVQFVIQLHAFVGIYDCKNYARNEYQHCVRCVTCLNYRPAGGLEVV
jgi:hypothetical protein